MERCWQEEGSWHGRRSKIRNKRSYPGVVDPRNLILEAGQTCKDLNLRWRILTLLVLYCARYCMGSWEALGNCRYLTLFDSRGLGQSYPFAVELNDWLKLRSLECVAQRSTSCICLTQGHLFIGGEDGNTIGAAIRVVRDWIQELPIYVLENSWYLAAEQKAVRISFADQESDQTGLHCEWHSEQALDRNLSGEALREANQHLRAALFSRRTEVGCDSESIQAALDFIPD